MEEDVMSKEVELLNFIFDKVNFALWKAHEDSLIYGVGYIRLKDGMIEHISPKQFEEEMIAIVSNMVKGAE